jgi:hypothetical protein
MNHLHINKILDPYVRAELRLALRVRHLGLLLLGVAIAVVDAVLTPRLPGLALDFLRSSLRLGSMADLILVNDYLGLYMIVLFAGAFELMRVYVGPAEARELDLYLAKPIGRAHFIAARSAPALLATLVVGAGISIANAVTLRLWLGDVALVPILAAGVMITAFVLVQLAALNLTYLWLREVEHAVLLAFALAIAPLLSTSVLIYRPDLFAGVELNMMSAFPASLLWHGGVSLGVALGALGFALVFTALLVGIAARRLDRRPDL